MTFACTDCSRCGKCYDKHAVCSDCGSDINLLDDACLNCGKPITEALRAQAKQIYIDKKKAEHDSILMLAAAAKARRESVASPKPSFPWDKPAQS